MKILNTDPIVKDNDNDKDNANKEYEEAKSDKSDGDDHNEGDNAWDLIDDNDDDIQDDKIQDEIQETIDSTHKTIDAMKKDAMKKKKVEEIVEFVLSDDEDSVKDERNEEDLFSIDLPTIKRKEKKKKTVVVKIIETDGESLNNDEELMSIDEELRKTAEAISKANASNANALNANASNANELITNILNEEQMQTEGGEMMESQETEENIVLQSYELDHDYGHGATINETGKLLVHTSLFRSFFFSKI